MIMTFVFVVSNASNMDAQVYRRENRRGNRSLAEQNYGDAIKHYEKGLANNNVDTLALIYNMAIALHSDRTDSTKFAQNDTLALQYLDRIANAVKGTEHEYGYHFNRGVIAIDMEDWQNAVTEFKQCILLDPDDMKARENYVYAKEHLQKNQSGGGGGSDGGSQGDGEGEGQSGQQQQPGDQQEDQQNQNQGDQQEDQQQGQGQTPEPKISQQNAQQMIKAIQAKERETMEKVEKKKSEDRKPKPNRKNW